MCLPEARKEHRSSRSKTESPRSDYVVVTDLEGTLDTDVFSRTVVRPLSGDDARAYRLLRKQLRRLGGRSIRAKLEPVEGLLLGTLPVTGNGRVIPTTPPPQQAPRRLLVLGEFPLEAVQSLRSASHVLSVKEYASRDGRVRKLSARERVEDYLRPTGRSDKE